MTREEEREIAAKESTKGDDSQDACIGKAYFIIGAEWADKTMIDRVCKWLRNNVTKYYDVDWRQHEWYFETSKMIKNLKDSLKIEDKL